MTATSDLYPTRGAAEVITPRQDPVVWSAPEPRTDRPPASSRSSGTASSRSRSCSRTTKSPLYRSELERLIADPAIRADERSIIEPKSQDMRSVFEVHRISEVFARLVRDERVVGRARQILGSDVYVHQSRINVKPGFGASGFYWHSDFETWHAEDGLPQHADGVRLDRADREPRHQRRPDDHARVAPDVPRLRGRHPEGQLQAVAADAGRGHAVGRGADEDGRRGTASSSSPAGRVRRPGSTATACTARATTSRRTRAATSSSCSTAWRTRRWSRSRPRSAGRSSSGRGTSRRCGERPPGRGFPLRRTAPGRRPRPQRSLVRSPHVHGR